MVVSERCNDVNRGIMTRRYYPGREAVVLLGLFLYLEQEDQSCPLPFPSPLSFALLFFLFPARWDLRPRGEFPGLFVMHVRHIVADCWKTKPEIQAVLRRVRPGSKSEFPHSKQGVQGKGQREKKGEGGLAIIVVAKAGEMHVLSL